MSSWRDLAAAALTPAGDDAAASLPALDGVPPEVREGVARLGFRRPPKISRPAVWPGIVADAERLLRDGWASQALALGWSPYDLFGIGPDDSDQYESLAIWLNGRKVAALAEWRAVTRCGVMFFRENYMRPNTPKFRPVYLWDWKTAR